MGRYVSRAKRLEEWQNEASKTASEARRLLEAGQMDKAKAAVDDLDLTELETLKEEMESWRDNMSAASMEHLPKYDEVGEACNALDDAHDSVNDLKEACTSAETTDDLASELDELDDAITSVEVLFPGMY